MSRSKLSVAYVAMVLVITSMAFAQKRSSKPTITSVSPTSASAGGATLTLTVTGTNFVSGAAVLWNGAALTTTDVSSTQLTATVPSTLLVVAGTSQITVYVPGRNRGTSNAVSFTINPVPTTTTTTTTTTSPLTITTTSVPAGTTGTAYSATLAASGGTSGYSWSVSSGALPPGLTLSTGGAISGTTTTSDSYAFTGQVKDSASGVATYTYSMSIITATTTALSITTASVPKGTASSAYSMTLAASGGTTPYTRSVAYGSTLPAGLALSTSGTLSGTPTTAATYSFSAPVKDSASNTATKNHSMTVAAATTSTAAVAALPRYTIDTTFPDTTNYTVTRVAAGGDLQSAINNAFCSPNGTVLRLASGAMFTGSYTLPAKSCTSGQWIIIRTDTADSNLPGPGARISPKYSPVLAKIFSNSSAAAIATASKANYYWFMGLEIGVTSTVTLNYGVFAVGSGETSASLLPNNVTLDRCYIHGNATGNIRRGLAANGTYIAAINSYFENFHDTGQDTQAVWAYNSPGPIKIVNNFLSAAGENVMFGGADPVIPNLVSSDIEIRQNHLFKPLTWFRSSSTFAGTTWVVKNLLELKNAQRVLVEANIIEYDWVQAQGGTAVLLTPRNQSGTCPWCTVADVTLRYNIIRHANGGIGISGADDEAGPSQPPQRIYIHDNLIYDINDAVYGPGEAGFLYQMLVTRNGAPHDIAIDHNTGFSSRVLAVLPDVLNPQPIIKNFQFTNNIAAYARYGFGGSHGVGTAALKYYCSNWRFTNNVIEGIQSTGNFPSDYPRGNLFPRNWRAVGFEDSNNCPAPPASGASVDANPSVCALSSSSPYVSRATDGGAIGANVSAIVAATAGVP